MASYGYSDAPVSSCGTYLDVSPIQFNLCVIAIAPVPSRSHARYLGVRIAFLEICTKVY